jgi:formiminotetrahydrofolate cyclodeaminase
MPEIKYQTTQQFLDELASKSATPGGGSAGALIGAQGAALVSMVCNLTIGKPKFADVEAELQDVLGKSEQLRQQLTDLIQADIDVFNQLMSKYAMPKDTDEEKTRRSAAIQDVLKVATEVPLQCAQACLEVIKLGKIVAEKGNPGVITDAGAGVMAAYGALKTAELNVYVNAANLKDKAFAEAKLETVQQISQSLEKTVAAIFDTVKARI